MPFPEACALGARNGHHKLGEAVLGKGVQGGTSMAWGDAGKELDGFKESLLLHKPKEYNQSLTKAQGIHYPSLTSAAMGVKARS